MNSNGGVQSAKISTFLYGQALPPLDSPLALTEQ